MSNEVGSEPNHLKTFERTGTGASASGLPEPTRFAVCTHCERGLTVRYSAREGFYIYPKHGACAGAGSAVPPGLFRRQES